MKFCLLTTFYPPFNFGGDGIDVQRIGRALVRRGHEVTVVHDVDAFQSVAGMKLPDQPRMQDGVEVIGLRSRLGVLSSLLTHQFGRPVVHGRAIERLIRARRFDVMLFNNVSLVGGPGLLAYGGDAARLYLAHEHWLVCPTHVLWRFNREPCDKKACTRCVMAYRRPPQIWRYTSLLDRELSNVDVFLARSEFSRKKHAEFGFKPAMQVLPVFLPDEGAGTDRAPSPRPNDRPYFLFVGRLEKIKGVASLLPAFAAYRDADLLVAGAGEEADALRHEAAGLPNVRFLGPVPNNELGRYYEHAVAALVPSMGYETFGMVLIEAFRKRTPVIARRLGPFPEIVGQAQGGLLFSSNDELIEAMRSLQQNTALRETLAASALAASFKLWSEDAVIGRLLEVSREALDARQKARRS